MKKKSKLKLIYYLSLIGFFAIFSTTLSKNPVLSLYTKALGGSDLIIGLIAAFSPLAGILFSFPVGILSDRIGRKKLLITSAIIFLISPLLYLFVNSAVWLIPLRFFHGLATAILGPVISAIIVENYSSDKGEKLGFYNSSTLVGRTLAPILGGAIISFFAISGSLINYKYVYLAAFILAIPVFILILAFKDQTRHKPLAVNLAEFYSDIKYFFLNKKIATTALVQLSIYFAYGAFETYLPIYLSIRGIPAYQIGLIFSIQIFSIALSQPIFGKIADSMDKRIQIVFGVVALGIAMACIGFLSSVYLIILTGILFSLGLSFSTIAINAYIAEISKKDKLGTSFGGLGSLMDVGQSMGPIATGVAITYVSFKAGFALSLVLALVIVVIFLFSNRNKH